MFKAILLLLFSPAILCAQTAPSTPSSQAPATQPRAATPASPAPVPPTVTKPEDVPLTAPVITIQGICPSKPAGTDPKSEACKTVVTRGQFEKLANTLAPNMPNSAKQQLAAEFSRMLVFSDEGRKRGLDKTQRFNDLLGFVRMQVLAREMQLQLQESAKPTAADIENHYKQNQGKYEELTLSRIFIPRNHPAEGTASSAQPKQATDEELKAQADKARLRLVAGETFEKVQKDIYDAAGFKTPPPPVTIPNWRREAVPPEQQKLFDLKKGEITEPMIEPAGAYVYRVEDRKVIPLDQARTEIQTQLTNERLRQQVDSISSHVKADVNQQYFRSLAGQGAGFGPAPGSPQDARRPAAIPPQTTAPTRSTTPKPDASTPRKPAPPSTK